MSKNIYTIAVFAFVCALLPSQAGAITGSGSAGTGTAPYAQYSQEEMRRLKEERNAELQEEREEMMRKKQEMMEIQKGSITDLRVQMKNASSTGTTSKPELRDKMKGMQEEFRDKMKDAREEAREKMKDVREEFRDKIGEERKSRIEAYFERTLRRLEAAFARLDELSDRIASRITKLEEKNKNIQTDEAKRLLGVAETKITEGKTLLAGLPAQFSTIFASSTASTTPQAQFEKVKTSTQVVVNAAKAAHAALVDAVASIKAQGGATSTATTTPPTTGTSTATTTSN